jgi:hypothetical protein
MEVNGQLHAPVALPLGKQLSVPIVYESIQYGTDLIIADIF